LFFVDASEHAPVPPRPAAKLPPRPASVSIPVKPSPPVPTQAPSRQAPGVKK